MKVGYWIGKWKYIDKRKMEKRFGYECSNCGVWIHYRPDILKFCPNCGQKKDKEKRVNEIEEE